jgi:hypothetical protein
LQKTFSVWPGPLRALALALWLAFFRVVCLLVAWDHRGVLRAVKIGPAEFKRDCNAVFDDVAGRIFDRRLLPEEVWWQGQG